MGMVHSTAGFDQCCSLNTVADTDSRCKNNNLEWMIDPDILQHLF